MSGEQKSKMTWLEVLDASEARFSEIAAANGGLVQFTKEAAFARQAFERTEYMRQCDPKSVFNAIINVAAVGLTLSPAEKLAYLVPRADGKGADRKVLCCLDLSYRGMKKIAEDSGGIETCVAEVVREGDSFEWIDKLTRPVHKFDPFAPKEERGGIRGVYCIAVLPSGTVQCEPLSMEEIAKIKAYSKAKDGPWVDWFEEMAKKTVVRRASKMWPHSSRMQIANTILDQHQGLVDLNDAPVLIEGPQSRTEGAQPSSEPPPASSGGNPAPAGGGKEHKKPEPMNPGQLKILNKRAANNGITIDALVAEFGPQDAWTFPDFEKIQKWIAGKAK